MHTSTDGFIPYKGQAFIVDYHGNAFVALFNRSEIAQIELERMGDGEYLARTEIFASGFFNPLDLAETDDGALYIIDFTTSGYYRVVSLNPPERFLLAARFSIAPDKLIALPSKEF